MIGPSSMNGLKYMYWVREVFRALPNISAPVRGPFQSFKFQISQLFRARSFLPFRQLQKVDSFYPRMWYDKNTQSMHHRDRFSQQSSTIWPFWLKGWVFVYELRSCRFESRCNPSSRSNKIVVMKKECILV